MAEHYRHSGTAPLIGIVGAFVFGLIAAVVCGAIYSFAVVWIPFIYINFLFTMGFGLAISGAIAWRARAGHIRSRFVPTVIGLLCGLVGLYVAWGVDFIARGALPDDAGLLDAFEPPLLSEYVAYFYEHGFWSIGRNNAAMVKGVWLGIVWGAEAILIVGVPGLLAWTALSDMIYCEACGCWCPAETGVSRLSSGDAATVAERVNAGDLRPLAETPRAAEEDLDFLRLDLARCPSCSESNFLTVEHVTVTVDKKGERSESSETLVEKLLLTARDVESVRIAGKPAAEGAGEPVFEAE